MTGKTLITIHFLKIFENCLNTVNSLINSHAILKKLNIKQKPWITKGIQNAIEKKNKLFKMLIKCGDCNKNILHQEYKTYRNSLSTLLKQSKKCYYNNYFINNINNIKNEWKGIKSIISLNTKQSESPKIILNNKAKFLTNTNDIPTNLITYFVSLHQILNLLIII